MKSCGLTNESNDVCGETYTCGSCRIEADRDRLREENSRLLAVVNEAIMENERAGRSVHSSWYDARRAAIKRAEEIK